MIKFILASGYHFTVGNTKKNIGLIETLYPHDIKGRYELSEKWSNLIYVSCTL